MKQYPLKAEVRSPLKKTVRQDAFIATADDSHGSDEIDAFVMAHSSLSFEEFFRRLRHLEAWRALLQEPKRV